MVVMVVNVLVEGRLVVGPDGGPDGGADGGDVV